MGAMEGMAEVVGDAEGMYVGICEGDSDGAPVGEMVGCCVVVGGADGIAVGWKLVDGDTVGE